MSHKRDYSKWKIYIRKVLKQVHPDQGISSEANGVMEALINDTIKNIMDASNSLAVTSSRKTVDDRNIQAAVRVCFPGELAKHAVSEGNKAVRKFLATIVDSNVGGRRRNPVSKAARSGLQFPPSRFKRPEGGIIKKLSILDRVAEIAGIYMAAVIEYIVAEILELAGNAARDYKKVRITPRHIFLAINGDEELDKLYKNVVIPGGVMPHIHAVLIPKKKGKKASYY